MIRPATEADVAGIVAMALALAGTSYGTRFIPSATHIEALTRRMLASPEALVLVATKGHELIGMLAMQVFEHPMSGERTAAEFAWWMNPSSRGAGPRLLTLAEQWARDRGAVVIQMVAPTERVGAFYRAKGYELVESSYQRRVEA